MLCPGLQTVMPYTVPYMEISRLTEVRQERDPYMALAIFPYFGNIFEYKVLSFPGIFLGQGAGLSKFSLKTDV